MRNSIPFKSSEVLRKKFRASWQTNIFVFVVAVIFLPVQSECSRGDMFRGDKVATAEVIIQSNAVSFKQVEGKGNFSQTILNSKSKPEVPKNKIKSTESTPTSDAVAPDYSHPFSSTFSPTAHSSKKSLDENVSPYASSTRRMDYNSKEDDNVAFFPPYTSQEVSEASLIQPYRPVEPKSAIPTLLFLTSIGTMATSTVKPLHYHKTSSSTIITKKKPTTKRPVLISTSKQPVLISTSKQPKVPRPTTPMPGGGGGSKRKRRPKPGRTTTTTTSTTPNPDDYEYYGSAEDTGESSSSNSSLNTNTTTTPTKMPLSKLAVAMISTSSEFDNNSTKDEQFYPQTPVNLLNILQAYTKQIQNGENAVKPPVVKIPNTPFMLNLNQLNFAAKLGISFYYSIIAIIPLVYLAFGGTGILDSITGRRRSGNRRRRKRSSGSFTRKADTNPTYFDAAQRADFNSDDDYAWIIARISQIILEISLFSEGEDD